MEPGVERAAITSESMSRPGGAPKSGKCETPQLFDTMSARGEPENSHSWPELSKPAVQSHA